MKTNNINEKKAQIHALRQRTIFAENHREVWSKDDKAMLKKLFEEDEDITEMALYFHRSELAVANQIAKLYPRVRKPKQGSEDCICPQCIHYKSCPGPCSDQIASTN